jgi:hypothetical protein
MARGSRPRAMVCRWLQQAAEQASRVFTASRLMEDLKPRMMLIGRSSRRENLGHEGVVFDD